MKIAYIGKFQRMDDEEYIALGFEKIGCEVVRIEDRSPDICYELDKAKPDLVLWAKLRVDNPAVVVAHCKKKGYKTACWVFDLYIGYHRENQLTAHPAFKADYVFTTDGGHQKEFEALGINHFCVRQGIANSECYLEPLSDTQKDRPQGVVFVGTDNPLNTYRTDMISEVRKYVPSLKWIGRADPSEMRGTDLNKLYAKTQVAVGDSVYSPYYWSNRIVETLGRGGFLIHPDVPGLKEEYPHLVTYPRGDWVRMKNTVCYYLMYEDKRRELVQKNFEWVRDNYTVDKKCAELLSHIK